MTAIFKYSNLELLQKSAVNTQSVIVSISDLNISKTLKFPEKIQPTAVTHTV